YMLLCFFFRAEDGIRVFLVTGVQTCALPIYSRGRTRRPLRVYGQFRRHGMSGSHRPGPSRRLRLVRIPRTGVAIMIDHTGLAVSDFAKSKAFYTAALAPLGYSLLMEFPAAERSPDIAGFGEPPEADFWIVAGTPN